MISQIELEPFLAAQPEVAPFFEAAREGRLVMPRCTGCARRHWYPRAVCPSCQSTVEWEPHKGEGRIYTYSVLRRVQEPYAIAYVELDGGPTVMTRIVDCDLDRLSIGMAVRALFMPSADGQPVLVFQPADAGS